MKNYKRKNLTDAQKEAICEAYKNGRKAKEIAKFFSISDATVYNVIKARDIDLHCPLKSNKKAEALTESVEEEITGMRFEPTTGDIMELLNNIGRAILLVHEDLKALNDSLN